MKHLPIASFNDFTAAYPPAIIQSPNLTSERAILNEESPPLALVSKSYGRNKAVAWLLNILAEWQTAMPVQGKMPPVQLQFLAENICKEFYYLRASEILLFLRQLMGGKFAVQWYGQLNPDIIIQAIREYFIPFREDIITRDEQKKKAQQPPSTPITWEQYCKNHNLPPRPSPLSVSLDSPD